MHTSKERGNNDRSAGNSVPQNLHRLASGFKFTDNRPEALVQQRLKGIIQRSISPFNSIIQMARLEAGRFNVAGEDHNESGKRGKEEFELSVANTGSENFWYEIDFKTDWSRIYQEDSTENKRTADPTPERVRYVMAEFFSALASLRRKVKPDELLNEKLPEKSQLDKSSKYEITNDEAQLDEPLKDGMSEEQIDDEEFELLFLEDKQNSLKRLVKAVSDLLAQLAFAETEEMYRTLQVGPPDISPLVRKMVQTSRNLKAIVSKEIKMNNNEELSAWLDQINTTSERLYGFFKQTEWDSPDDSRILDNPGAVMDEAAFERSKAMHETANLNHAVPGLWKIGQNHVEDIKNLLAQQKIDPVQYNLLTKDEFQEIYDEHYPKK